MSEKEPDPEDVRYELFMQRFVHNEPSLRLSLMPTWTDVDEVLQQTAIMSWRKFEQYDSKRSFLKWACGIARYEVLAYRRKVARDRLIFREDILELMAEEGIDEIDERRMEHDALERCLQEMPDEQRQFLTLAHTPGVKVAELAKEAGSTAAAFYMRLKRLRRQLMQCIESKTLSPEGI